MNKVKPNNHKWRLDREFNGAWEEHSAHVSCDAAKTRARDITGWYSNPRWRVVSPTGETYAIGQKRTQKMKWKLQ